MKEIISLILAFSSLFFGVTSGDEVPYSWQMRTREESHEIQEQGDKAAAVEFLPAARRVPERRPGVERPTVDARSALVLEAETGRVLYAEDRDTARPLASLTKLMTALVALDHIGNLEAPVTVTREDYAGSGRLYVYAGDVFSVRDLLFLSLVSSANDATLALARATGLNRAEFVKAMNEKARELRLVRAEFVDPTGLVAGNVATAEEVARLLHTSLARPLLREALSLKEYRFATADGRREGVAVSTDQLLTQMRFGVVGGKTGYIDESGYNFAVQVTLHMDAPLKEGEEMKPLLTIIILGAKSEDARFAIASQLVEWAEKAWDFGNNQ